MPPPPGSWTHRLSMPSSSECDFTARRASSPNNSKNQMYLGGDFAAANLIPNDGPVADVSGESPILKAAVQFAWLTRDGGIEVAPSAQLILYPQYPEVRMSSFLKGCKQAPTELFGSRTPGRVMFFGISADGRVLGYLAAPKSALIAELDALPNPEQSGIFLRVPMGENRAKTSRDVLLGELGRIHRLGWIDSKRLDADGNVLRCEAQQCGGYTLEAELGVRPQGRAEPDFQGWEVKQHEVRAFDRPESGGPLTLFTPEPTLGVYAERGPEFFVREYGYPDRRGRPDRLNFGGVHVIGERHPLTKLTLTLRGYDAVGGHLLEPDAGVALLADDGTNAAEWRYVDLMKHWQRKHAQAVYVPSKKRGDPRRQYHYGPKVRLGEGTDFLRLLRAFSSGRIYYDPGIKLEGAASIAPRLKRRSQFRIRPNHLGNLYGGFTTVSV